MVTVPSCPLRGPVLGLFSTWTEETEAEWEGLSELTVRGHGPVRYVWEGKLAQAGSRKQEAESGSHELN